jgi:amino acid adenylation domain-containing protein
MNRDSRMSGIEDIYELSPMQHGLLFHTLTAPASGIYLEQMGLSFRKLNTSAFKRAWQRLVERHAVLRTSFHWEELDKPLQMVHKKVELPWEQYDWRGASSAEQDRRLENYLRADRERGFELAKVPLMRFVLVRTAEEAYHFIWSFHHILIDGWCLPIVLGEVFAFYQAFCRGDDLHLPHPLPYREYITWLQRQDLSEAEDFWRKVLKGFTVPTSLKIGRTAGELGGQADEYAEQERQLSIPLTQTLRSFARQHHLTLNTLVQGAWAILLSRYSGEKDVVFGITMSGRPADLDGAESMVGLFINTLPMRVPVLPEAPLLPWLNDLQTQQFKLRRYEYTPLVKVQGWSQVPRGTPLFESLLVFENYPMDTSWTDGDGETAVVGQHFRERTNYPLVLKAIPATELYLQIGYDRHRFDAIEIAHMLEHLQNLLEGIVDPNQCLADLSILTATERHQLLIEWNDTSSAYPQNQCIHEMFEEQVERTPEEVAVAFEGQHLTYGELNRRANQLGHYLQGLGVGPDVFVGICAERSLDMVVGLLGVLKAGGAYVPLDPAHPHDRLIYILEDSQTPMLLTQQQVLREKEFLSYGGHVVLLDSMWETISCESESPPGPRVVSENLAYCIYTSGSTGRPKGVQVMHRAVVNFLASMRRQPGFTSGDVLLAVTTLSFDIAGLEIFLPLVTGGRVVLVSHAVAVDGVRLAAWLADCGATVMQATPATWQLLLESGWEGNEKLNVLCGGEALPRKLANRLIDKVTAVWNMYGPTETTIWSSVHPVEAGDSAVPIGRPIANTQFYVLDRYLKPVPIGMWGELYIDGNGLARGYLNRPELTAEKFVPNPFGDEEGARLYRTGDMVRYLSDGSVEFLGRVDYQVKVHGHRIELGEIEAALRRHPMVQKAVVLAREDRPNEKRLIAYIVPSQGAALKVEALRRFLGEILPDYMLPAVFVTLDRLPLTANGKVDRRALPAPKGDRPAMEKALVAPRTPTEKALTRIWAEILGIEQVGVHDNFFELGGDSLLIMTVVAKAYQAGLRFSPQQLFQHQTIVELLAAMEGTVSVQPEQELVLRHLFD